MMSYLPLLLMYSLILVDINISNNFQTHHIKDLLTKNVLIVYQSLPNTKLVTATLASTIFRHHNLLNP